jgi:hypothetical protein
MDADDASRTLSPHEVELSAILERLAQVIEPEYIPLWLDTPVPALTTRNRSTSSRAASGSRSKR